MRKAAKLPDAGIRRVPDSIGALADALSSLADDSSQQQRQASAGGKEATSASSRSARAGLRGRTCVTAYSAKSLHEFLTTPQLRRPA